MPSSDRPRRPLGNERGIALVIVAVLLAAAFGLIGMAIDLGRGYIVRNALASAVDAAALAAARAIPQSTGAAQAAANKIFNANFPPGFLGVTSVTNPPNFSVGVADDGSYLINISSQAVVPTTFIRVLGMFGPSLDTLNVSSAGQATRRLVDMAFVIDRSGSLAGVFGDVRNASSEFVSLFNTTQDRISLISFSNNVVVHHAIRTPARGYVLGDLQTSINALVENGNTSTAEGLYQGWNQLRRVPRENQSGLRVIVLFTDGAPNSYRARFFPNGSGIWSTCSAQNVPGGNRIDRTGTLISGDPFPGDNTQVQGLWDTYSANWNLRIAPTVAGRWVSPNSSNFTLPNPCIDLLPPVSDHVPQQGDGGVPRSFPIYDGAVTGQLPLINPVGVNFTNHVQNANNAARNLAEIMAHRIRTDDTGIAPIHIFALGLGNLLTRPTGSNLETGESMLRRIANDPASPSFDALQPEGGYFFAGSSAELDHAFQAIRDRIIRISQ